MKKKLLLVIPVLFIAIIYSGCSSVKETPKEEAKKVEAEVKEPPRIIKNLEQAERDYISSSKIKEIDRLQFDYDSKGNLTGRKKLSSVIYDEKGFQQETIIFNDAGQIDSKFDYKYNRSGVRTETIRHNDKGAADKKYVYEYNRHGNKIKAVRFDIKNNMEKYYEYKYDDDGNLTEEQWYDKNGKLEYNIKNEYDKKGNKIVSYSYGANNELQFRYEYKYDSKSNLIEEEKYTPDGKKLGIIQYVYKYH